MNHRALYALARRYEPRFHQTFLDEIAIVKTRITDAVVGRVLAAGLLNDPLELYALIDAMQIAKADTTDTLYANLIVESGKMELKGQGLPTLAGSFRITSPFVLQAARTQAANLVTDVSRETKMAIRQVVFESIRDGDAPVVAARTIRELVGLTQRDAMAVKRFADKGATDKGIARYSRKLLNARAKNIARTETMRASNIGQQEAWKEMAHSNLVDTSNFLQQWMVTPDDRLCDECAPMDGMLVPLDGSFTSSERGVLPSDREAYAGDTVDQPPLHPNCRCVLVASFGE